MSVVKPESSVECGIIYDMQKSELEDRQTCLVTFWLVLYFPTQDERNNDISR